MFLAVLLRDTNRLDEAIQHVEQALPCYIQSYGQQHSEVRYIASVLASMEKQRSASTENPEA
jgi:hypothetical protein